MIKIDCWGLDLTPYLKPNSFQMVTTIGNRREVQFTLVSDSSRMWIPAIGSDLKVYDGPTVLFGGVIRGYRFTAPLEYKDTGRLFVTVQSDGYDSIAYRHTVGETHWRNTTAGAIVRNMCSSTLLGSDYVSEGHIDEGISVKTYDVSAKSVKDILDDMANASGGKWFIDENKRLNFYVNEPVTYAPSLDSVAYRNVEVEQSLEDYINKIFIIGGTKTDGQRLFVYFTDTDAVNERRSAEGGSGIYGRIIDDETITTDTDAVNLANQMFAQYGVVPTTLTFETFDNRFKPGQIFNAYLPRFGINETMLFLVEEVDVTDLDASHLLYTVKAVRRKSGSVVNRSNQHYIDYVDQLVKGIKKGKGEVGAAVVEYKRAAWQVTTQFEFSTAYLTQPVVVVTLDFDYVGGSGAPGSVVGMYPLVELLTAESQGIVSYIGVKVTWTGSVPSSLPNAYTNMIAVIGA